MQLDHAFQNVRSKNARFQYVRKLRQNVRADATKLIKEDTVSNKRLQSGRLSNFRQVF